MIQNDEQLQVVRQQIARLEDGLRSLALTVRPKSEANFRVFAEGYVDQLDVLRGEIDRYLGIEGLRDAPDNERQAMETPIRK